MWRLLFGAYRTPLPTLRGARLRAAFLAAAYGAVGSCSTIGTCGHVGAARAWLRSLWANDCCGAARSAPPLAQRPSHTLPTQLPQTSNPVRLPAPSAQSSVVGQREQTADAEVAVGPGPGFQEMQRPGERR